MTATTERPSTTTNDDAVRISWMETLGFSESTSVWSDRPEPQARLTPGSNGRHVRTVADWQPTEVGAALNHRRVRWGLLLTVLSLIGLIAWATVWYLGQPAERAENASANVASEATSLAATLPALQTANASLVEGAVDSAALVAADQAARALFDASSNLEDQPDARSAASEAASKSLDAVRLINDANAYRLAVAPMLSAPDLVVDPELIELEDAARAFGDWQLDFDAARTSLPDGVLSDVTQSLDILSANLSNTLRTYLDALRNDDVSGARQAVADLSDDLESISVEMELALGSVQERAAARITDAKAALDLLVG